MFYRRTALVSLALYIFSGSPGSGIQATQQHNNSLTDLVSASLTGIPLVGNHIHVGNYWPNTSCHANRSQRRSTEGHLSTKEVFYSRASVNTRGVLQKGICQLQRCSMYRRASVNYKGVLQQGICRYQRCSTDEHLSTPEVFNRRASVNTKGDLQKSICQHQRRSTAGHLSTTEAFYSRASVNTRGVL